MNIDDDQDTQAYRVVCNHEEQYSIWPQQLDLPPGWVDVGTSGTKAECLEHIRRVWTDIRPLSLRRKLADWEAKAKAAIAEMPAEDESADAVDDLVRRLSTHQPIEVSIRPEPTPSRLREALERGRVHIRFTATSTELGVPVDRTQTDTSSCDFDAGKGTLKLRGRLVLNYNRVEVDATIDLASLRGTAALRFVEAVSPQSLFAS